MNFLFEEASRSSGGKLEKTDIASAGGSIADMVFPFFRNKIFDFNNITVFPGFCDVHVHLREPGFSYKETIKTGTLAAARGGYTNVCTMPNLSPVPDSAQHLQRQLEIIERDALIGVHPFGSISIDQRGEALSDMAALAPFVCGFSDDGRGVQSAEFMERAMLAAKSFGKVISAHCEVNSLLHSGYIHDGFYAKAHGHRGISSESEYRMIERDIALAKKTGCAYHVCHISTKESVQLIREAKKEGVDITSETAPHYLLLDESSLQEDGRFKMNPPLRSAADRETLLEGLADGTIDMIATDHAPHSAEEKSRGLEKSLFGITGIETAFPLLYTYLVKTKLIGLEKLLSAMHSAPMKRFGIKETEKPSFCACDLTKQKEIRSSELISMGKSTPFDGTTVFGENILTVYNGNIVWEDIKNACKK